MMTNLLSSAVMTKTRQLLSTLASTRLLLVVFMTLCVSANAWGAEETISVSDFTQCSASEITQSVKGFTFYCENGLIDSDSFRSYSGKIFRITSNVGSMSKIEFTFTSSSANRSWGQNATTYIVYPNADTWEITGPNQARIKTIVITYETAASYTVTYNANGGSGTMSNSTGSSIEIKECTFTAPECKQFTSWNTAANGSGTSYAPNATVTTNLTLYAQWGDLPSYTVKLMDNNEVLTSSCNTPITLPSRDGCDGYEFVGWTKSWSVAQTTWTTTAPAIIPTGSYTPTANESLYPVYTKTEGGGSEPIAYSAGDEGDFVIASYNTSDSKWYAIPENPTLSSDKITGVEITVSQTAGGVNYVSTANAEGYTWTIADATNGQTISDGSKYIYHSNGGASGTDLAYGTSTSYTWKIEKENNGLTFKGMNGSATNSRGLLFNGSVFGGYALSNEDASGYYRIQVLPIGGGSTTSYISVPDCITQQTPSLIADPTSLAFGNVATDSNKEMTFTLTGSNLTANATLALSGTNESMFSVNPTSVTQSEGTIDPQNITVTYTPTAAGEHTATLTISSTGAESKTVTLSGTGVAPAAKYTVTFNAGSGTCDDESLTETSGGAGVTLPTANPPAACATDGWEFAGWWTEEVSSTNTSPGTLLNAGDTYNPTSDITLYAVYSTQEAGDAFTGYAKVTTAPDDWSGKYLLSTGEYTATGAFDSNGTSGHLVRTTYTPENEEKAEWEFTLAKVGNTGYSILFPDGSWYLGHYDGTNFGRSIDDPSKNEAYLWTPSTSGITNVGDNTRIIKDGGSDFRPYVNDNSIVYLYKRVGGGSTTIYNSNPTCLVPVWEGATIDKTSFTVNCGERSPMTGANGAAIISFPTEDIYNFTKDIKIEATTGFLVSTNQNVDANYKSSVSLSPLVGTANANTFYNKFVYVRAEAPAMSEEDLSGTITIKNNKGETLQTFSVTADVTCNKCTVQFVDRGANYQEPILLYAGETIDEAPVDPEGVCTDPIHYVFDGWAEATVAAGSTTYTKVTFPYTVEGNTKFYAVYRYLEGGGNGDYNLVTSALDDWSGDYLIAYSDQIFANGTIGGESGIGAKNNKVDLSSNISNNTIPATVGDQYNVTLETVTGGYVLKTQDGKYNYHTNNTGNGISASTIGYADDYPISVDFVSQEEINLCLGGNAIGSKFRYNTDGYFRFYQNGGQQPVYLYKKADGTTYYTTSPVCGPHLAITEGKDIYVTGGNAGGTRDLVIAQQKVSYKATRLQTSNGLDDGTAPDVKVATNGITVGGVVTSDVKVTIDQTKEQQTDGTYTITGTITVQYQPSANNKQEDIQVQLAVDYNAEARDNFTVHARSLPAEFVIVAKSGDKWYALNGDMNTNAANPANGQVTLDNDANPTKATYAPCNTIYTFDGLPNTGDRTYVRFQGTDGAWLWSSSGTNVGIQNNVLKTTPEGNNNAYNWKLYTQDNITYQFGNANSNRQLTLNGEKFGMYASGVQDIRILPYVEKCLYNYAPSNLKVSVLKGTYVTLTWDAVPGATKYQYSTDATSWTDAGTEPTVTINGLTGDTEYTYYIRAYHEDAGVSQECIDYAEITFTTADCDDVPTDITYSADMNSIIVSWIANAATSTVNLYSDEEAEVLVATQSVASPCTFTDLAKNTQYYVQILANGTCASPIIPVKTEDVEVDIVEWQPQGIIVDINTDETIGVTLENEVSYGTGVGVEATELFFSKYYEASYNVKLVAIYNGTKNIIDLTDYTIQYGKTSWESNYITLKDFGATKGQIQPGEEIILYSYTENNADDKRILDCVHDAFPDGNWVRVTSSNNDGKGTLSFGGDKTIILCKTEYDDEKDEYYDNIIDVIGALIEDPNVGFLPTNTATEEPSWGDKEGWVCENGLSIADDSQIGISTNRCLLIRNNTVTSGDNAVTQNINDFVTLCSEWKGAHVPDDPDDNGVQASCDNFAYVGTFDYSDYYTKYVPMGESSTFDENDRNADGTVTIPITDLYKHACSNIRVKLTNSNSEVLSDREYKVPIMITTTQGTDGQAFLDLQQNLATKEVDGEGNVIDTHPLTLDEVREICKTCDVVVRDNATLTKVTDGTTNDHPQVHDVIVYEGASIVIPDGNDHNYTINSLALRRKGDDVASAQVQGTGKFVLPADAPVTLSMRIDANNWHWFTLPYDCDIADVTWSDGTEAKYNTDWFLMYYDGESRSNQTSNYESHWKVYNGTTIEAGKGYIIGITGDLAHPNYTFELRFPMAQEVLTKEQENKTVAVNAWGVKKDIRPNHKGWNLVGNPYLNYYKTADEYSLAGLPLIHYINTDLVTGEWNYENSGSVPYVVTPIDGGWYEYQQELASEVNMMPFTAYFVQVGDPNTHENGQALNASFEASNRGKKSILRRAQSEVDDLEEPAIVAVSLTNAKGESDKTTLLIANRFTNEYEMNADFFKWFGDYYTYYTKPVLYSIGADSESRAFNALNEELAAQPVALGMYAAQTGNYTFSLHERSNLTGVAEVWLHDASNNTHTNLLQDDYTFSTSKTNGAGRFSLSVKMMPKLPTDVENIKQGNVWATTQGNNIVINGLTKDMQLWIYDATGKLLHADRTTNYQHGYSVPQTGAYFVRVHDKNDAQTIKVVVE